MPKTLDFVLDRVKEVDNCWEWQRFVNKHGYGLVAYREDGIRRSEMAHRLSYRICVGEIEKNFQLDHLCRNRRCVNPAHLEPVTAKENIQRGDTGKFPKPWFRKTHCKHGHEYTPENTYIKPNGYKNCRICIKEANKRHKKGE